MNISVLYLNPRTQQATASRGADGSAGSSVRVSKPQTDCRGPGFHQNHPSAQHSYDITQMLCFEFCAHVYPSKVAMDFTFTATYLVLNVLPKRLKAVNYSLSYRTRWTKRMLLPLLRDIAFDWEAEHP